MSDIRYIDGARRLIGYNIDGRDLTPGQTFKYLTDSGRFENHEAVIDYLLSLTEVVKLITPMHINGK
jgi:hypothetical protein